MKAEARAAKFFHILSPEGINSVVRDYREIRREVLEQAAQWHEQQAKKERKTAEAENRRGISPRFRLNRAIWHEDSAEHFRALMEKEG